MFRTPISRGPGAGSRGQKPPRPAPSGLRPDQEGYTLAALIVILTIIAVIVSFTVPPQWSLIMRREREKQTIFLMKQFARGILAWEQKHQGPPPNLEMLQKARQPRFLRGDGKWPMPLTGRTEDWIMVPPQAILAAGVVPPPGGQPGIGIGRNPANPATSTAPNTAAPQGGTKFDPAASPKDYVGPFVAVRPNATGPSLIALNGAEDYSQWIYTVQDLKTEIANRQMAMSMPK